MDVRNLLTWVFALALPVAAAAQDAEKSSGANAADQAGQSQGPMIVERVHNGFAIAPDFKVTKVDGAMGRLAGAYGGCRFDNTPLIGGAGLGLRNSAREPARAYDGEAA